MGQERDTTREGEQTRTTLSVTASALNVRAGASSSTRIVDTVRRGTKLEQTGRSGNWINIAYGGGQAGWVYAKYTKVEESAPTQQSQQPRNAAPDKPEETTGARDGLDLAAALRYNRQRGLTRDQWKQVQRAVGVPDDGIVGPATTRAIYDFQAEKGLTPDGKCGANTQRAAGVEAVATSGRDPKAEDPDAAQDNEGTGQAVPRGNITANFTWEDFVSATERVPVPPRYQPNVIALCRELEVLRAALRAPVNITPNGGYREKRGVSRSQHKVGKAADIQVPGVRPSQVRATIRRLISEGKMRNGGIGSYASFSHYDIGPPRTWNG